MARVIVSGVVITFLETRNVNRVIALFPRSFIYLFFSSSRTFFFSFFTFPHPSSCPLTNSSHFFTDSCIISLSYSSNKPPPIPSYRHFSIFHFFIHLFILQSFLNFETRPAFFLSFLLWIHPTIHFSFNSPNLWFLHFANTSHFTFSFSVSLHSLYIYCIVRGHNISPFLAT